MNRILDAAVLGAGIAGSSMAKALADRGWETVLLDRQTFPRHKVCGEFLSPESQSTLQAFGLLGPAGLLHPSCIERVRIIFINGAEIEIPLPGIALGVSRYSLDTALHLAAGHSGVQLHTATTVTSVTKSGEGYFIETKREGEHEVIQAKAVIAAWGANCRAGLPGNRSSVSARQSHIGVKAHFQGIDMEPVIELYFFPGGYLGICPIEGGLVNAAALLGRGAYPNADKTVLGMIAAAARANPKLYKRLTNAAPVPGTQAAVAPVDLKRKPLAWDMIPQVGDAAMMIPPLCGDGMSMALRSAQLCTPLADSYLSGEISLAGWQREYTRSIYREFKQPLRWGRFLQWLFGVPVMPWLLPGAAMLAPGLAARLVRATRLKPTDF
jgi:flavin-dependent dehydrogenase